MDKAEVLQNVETESQKLQEAVKGLGNDQMAEVWLDSWSAKDILAHVLGWEQQMIIFLERMARGERPTPEGVDYSDPQAWNDKFALEYAPIGGATVLAIWRQVHMNFVKGAEALPDDRTKRTEGTCRNDREHDTAQSAARARRRARHGQQPDAGHRADKRRGKSEHPRPWTQRRL